MHFTLQYIPQLTHCTGKRKQKHWSKFKDECSSLQPDEFIGFRSKMYSLKLPNGRIKITAKGVSRSHVLKNFKHNNYRHTLQTTKASYATFRTITSHMHAVKTQEANKLCLLAFDDKRYILPDGVSMLMDILESPNWTLKQKRTITMSKTCIVQ